MAAAAGDGGYSLAAPAAEVRRVRNALRRAVRVLAQHEALLAAVDGERFGTYRLAPGEPLDEQDLLRYLRRARREHPQQTLTIAVLAHDDPGEDPAPQG